MPCSVVSAVRLRHFANAIYSARHHHHSGFVALQIDYRKGSYHILIAMRSYSLKAVNITYSLRASSAAHALQRLSGHYHMLLACATRSTAARILGYASLYALTLTSHDVTHHSSACATTARRNLLTRVNFMVKYATTD
jgi:hypothetical protein